MKKLLEMFDSLVTRMPANVMRLIQFGALGVYAILAGMVILSAVQWGRDSAAQSGQDLSLVTIREKIERERNRRNPPHLFDAAPSTSADEALDSRLRNRRTELDLDRSEERRGGTEYQDTSPRSSNPDDSTRSLYQREDERPPRASENPSDSRDFRREERSAFPRRSSDDDIRERQPPSGSSDIRDRDRAPVDSDIRDGDSTRRSSDTRDQPPERRSSGTRDRESTRSGSDRAEWQE